MVVTAKFKGENSLGFIKGNIYTFAFYRNTIVNTPDGGCCPYDSVQAFLNNWEEVNTLVKGEKEPCRQEKNTLSIMAIFILMLLWILILLLP